MGIFRDRLNQLMSLQTDMSPTLPGSQAMRQRSPLYNTEKFYGIQPTVQPQQMPQVDTSHALSSISQLMGPTPAEREAELRKQEAHNNKMMKWAGLFDGLRQLGNLYTTYKGATPQQLQAPYGQLEQQADRQRKLQAADDAYRREYANAYMRLQHGLNDDARKAKLAEAQAKWFDTRGETAQQKAELEKLKAVLVVKQKDGSLWKFDQVSGELEQLKESDPLYIKYVQSQIDKNNRMGYGRSGKTTSTTNRNWKTLKKDAFGNVIGSTERIYSASADQPPRVTEKKVEKKSDKQKPKKPVKKGGGNTGNIDMSTLSNFSIRK